MRHDLTDITFVLDRSGSMGSIRATTIESFNKFLKSQQEAAGTAVMSLLQFDDKFDLMYSAIPVDQAPALNAETYVPRGSTALLDAMGQSIQKTGERLRDMPEHERPGTVLFVTLTDGEENASRVYSLDKINAMIREQRDVYSWQFIFLGANQDAIATAAKMGIAASQSLTFMASCAGAANTFGSLDRQVQRMRAQRSVGFCDAQVEFDDEDRKGAVEGDQK